MSRATIIQKLRKIINDVIGVDNEITESTNFMYDLGFDSLDITEVLFRIEGDFKCDIRDAESKAMETVGELVDYINLKIATV